MDIRDLLLASVLAGQSETESDETTAEESEDLYKKYVGLKKSAEEIKPGDRIERNFMGKKRYKLPKENGIGVCVKRLDIPVLDNDGMASDMVVMFTIGKKFIHCLIDSTYYKVAGTKDQLPNNVFKLKKKTEDE